MSDEIPNIEVPGPSGTVQVERDMSRVNPREHYADASREDLMGALELAVTQLRRAPKVATIDASDSVRRVLMPETMHPAWSMPSPNRLIIEWEDYTVEMAVTGVTTVTHVCRPW